jgi:hypothetical protein
LITFHLSSTSFNTKKKYVFELYAQLAQFFLTDTAFCHACFFPDAFKPSTRCMKFPRNKNKKGWLSSQPPLTHSFPLVSILYYLWPYGREVVAQAKPLQSSTPAASCRTQSSLSISRCNCSCTALDWSVIDTLALIGFKHSSNQCKHRWELPVAGEWKGNLLYLLYWAKEKGKTSGNESAAHIGDRSRHGATLIKFRLKRKDRCFEAIEKFWINCRGIIFNFLMDGVGGLLHHFSFS